MILKPLKNHLDESCSVIVNNEIAAEGREAMLPSYVSDFEKNANVELLKELELVEENEEVSKVRVVMYAPLPDSTVDVTYVMRKEDGKMIQHIIHAVSQGKVDK